jgi:hypothetical protein
MYNAATTTYLWVELQYDAGLSKWVVTNTLPDSLAISELTMGGVILGDSSPDAAGEFGYDGDMKWYDTAARVAVAVDKEQTLTSKTLTSPVINGATGTGGKFTGDLTGLAPPVVVLVSSGTQDGGDDAAILTDGGITIAATNALIGMTLYNTTDGSSCTVTANTATTITCTLAGGTGNDWDDGDTWSVGPGPAQSGSVFYIAGATTTYHPATVGYTACYVAEGTNKLTVDMASASMVFTGTLNAAVESTTAGDYLTSSDTTEDDYLCIHNKTAILAKGLGKRGTWTQE